ncbi:hypothetical protein [Terrabacter sp. Soil810]|uniref:hypothetical protein n=1 Tax=Terrabacter sp. Soil810 TaxID=1736418 RepID=UPI00070A6D04|nr:hypothetical protein [Terrabacter sp. Soil810]KRF46294.1 hypothetical protein ASG96_20605 [Terrabacter sp. Soil810]
MSPDQMRLAEGPDTANPSIASSESVAGFVVTPTSPENLGLNYFDGRFLRADDLNFERLAQRAYIDVGRRSAGSGCGYGLTLSSTGTTVTVGSGAGIDRSGRLISLNTAVTVEFARLVSSSEQPDASVGTPPSGVYIVALSRQTQLAGNAEVLGRLCDCGCTSSSDRPTTVDGVRISARLMPPLTLPPPPAGLADESKFLRSRIASAFFDDERDRTWTPMSGQSLSAAGWSGGESPDADLGGVGLDIGILLWNGSSVAWHDDWIARRDLVETRPRTYWANQVEQRPWAVFIAQVLQFQSQLASTDASAASGGLTAAGFVAVPPTGYLRVTPTTATALRSDLETLFGAGIDLRVGAVRRDQIAQEFERAQHMERISLVRGLADPAHRQLVDVLVPDGVVEASTEGSTSHGFSVDFVLPQRVREPGRELGLRAAADAARLRFQGVGRFSTSGGISVRAAVAGTDARSIKEVMSALTEVARGATTLGSAIATMRAQAFGTGGLSHELLRQVAHATALGAAQHRVTRSRARFVNVAEAGGRVGALGGSLWVGMDPFALGDGKQTIIHGTWEHVMPQAAATIGMRVQVDGVLQRLFLTAGPGGEKLTVQVDGLVRATGSGAAEQKTSFSRRMELTRDQSGPQSDLTLVDVRSRATVTVMWQGSPIEATGDLGTAVANGPDDVQAQFTAQETQAIDQPGNDYRDAAISALQLLAGLDPKDPSYFDDNLALLFPDQGVEVGRSGIRPIYDWVLFRRRLREEYAGSAAGPELRPAQVAVWVATAETADQAEQYRRFLLTGTAPVPWTPTAVQLVVFDPGTATLRSSAAEWRQRYEAARGGDALVLAAYARSSSSTELPVGLPRAKALVAATAPSATMDADGQFEILPNPPAAQMSVDTDGSIFLIGYTSDAVEVVAVDTLGDADLLKAVTDGDVKLLAAAPADVFTVLASSNRSGQLVDPPAKDVITRLDEWKGDVETQHASSGIFSAVIWTATGVSDARSTRAVDRAQSIIKEIGLDPANTKVAVDFRPGPGVVARVYLTIVTIVEG